MSIRAKDLRQYVIAPTLQQIGLWSQSAENLLLGTAAQESNLGTYLHQVNGPALGIYQIEPNTHKDLWVNFLNFRSDLASLIHGLVPNNFNINNPKNELIRNLGYATAITRLIYLRIPAKLPAADDILGLANYWKKHYNTFLGKGTTDEFMENYNNLVTDK